MRAEPGLPVRATDAPDWLQAVVDTLPAAADALANARHKLTDAPRWGGNWALGCDGVSV
jgi:hypothetical protein